LVERGRYVGYSDCVPVPGEGLLYDC